MKKIIALVLALMILMSMTACGAKPAETPPPLMLPPLPRLLPTTPAPARLSVSRCPPSLPSVGSRTAAT